MVLYVALMRGINVGGKRSVRMATLKDALLEEFDTVITYLQSGNVVFSTRKTNPKLLEKKFHSILEKKFDLDDVPVMVFNSADFAVTVQQSPYQEEAEDDPTKVHFIFLNKQPDSNLVEEFQKVIVSERFQVLQSTLYLHTPDGFASSKVGRTYEKKLSISGTARNWNTVEKVLREVDKLAREA